jgi:hypothetical protein
MGIAACQVESSERIVVTYSIQLDDRRIVVSLTDGLSSAYMRVFFQRFSEDVKSERLECGAR